VLARKNNYQILVGFLGATGSGKTTLINALVGSQHLLPASTWRACTAVAVEIGWNASNDGNSLYRAEVVYITSEEWKAELDQFYLDLNAPAAADNDDDTDDSERKERIKELFDKLKCVYPKIKKIEHAQSTCADRLAVDPVVRGLLGTTTKIRHADKRSFAQEIMTHIDSGNFNGEKSARWPLVKLVRVFVKSPFLEHGITLVDLPGNLDNNAGRSAIAEHYQKEMSVTCILAQAKRGIDDKNAHDLLEKVAKRNLQLDAQKELAEADTAHSDAQIRLDEAGDEVDSLKRRLASIEKQMFWTKSRIYVACIKDRNDLSTAAVRRDFDETLAEMGRTSSNPLSVFCTASRVYLEYLKKDNDQKHPGFPNREDTQIPALRDWLVGTTFSNRERYAQAFLEDVETMLESMSPWINDEHSDQKMTAELRGIWEPHFKTEVSKLQEKLSNLGLETSRKLKGEVELNLYSVIPSAETAAAAESKVTVSDRVMLPHVHGEPRKKMHWSTHRSVNRQQGDWRDSNRRTHHWNADIALDLTKGLVAPWAETFQVKFPNAKDAYIAASQRLIADFAEAVASSGIRFEVPDGLQVLADHVMRTQALLQIQTDVIFDGLASVVKTAHRTVAPAVKLFLAPMYETCGNEGGTGHFARNKATHKKTMNARGLAMHKAGSGAMKTALNNMLNGIPQKFDSTNDAVLEQIRDELQLFFNQNSTSGNRLSGRRPISMAKIQLKKSLMVTINQLGKDWSSELSQQTQPDTCDVEQEEDTSFRASEFVTVSEGADDSDYMDK
ncbi:hypothetical protein DL98DRAFT_641647, partial [Cadophora sp. DSE1049]